MQYKAVKNHVLLLIAIFEVNPKVWTKNIKLFVNEFGTQPGSFLLI